MQEQAAHSTADAAPTILTTQALLEQQCSNSSTPVILLCLGTEPLGLNKVRAVYRNKAAVSIFEDADGVSFILQEGLYELLRSQLCRLGAGDATASVPAYYALSAIADAPAGPRVVLVTPCHFEAASATLPDAQTTRGCGCFGWKKARDRCRRTAARPATPALLLYLLPTPPPGLTPGPLEPLHLSPSPSATPAGALVARSATSQQPASSQIGVVPHTPSLSPWLLALNALPAAVTVCSLPTGAIRCQNDASVLLYGDLAAAGSAAAGGEGRDHEAAASQRGPGSSLLSLLFSLEPGKLAAMAAAVAEEGGVWQGIIRVPRSLRGEENGGRSSLALSRRSARGTATGAGDDTATSQPRADPRFGPDAPAQPQPTVTALQSPFASCMHVVVEEEDFRLVHSPRGGSLRASACGVARWSGSPPAVPQPRWPHVAGLASPAPSPSTATREQPPGCLDPLMVLLDTEHSARRTAGPDGGGVDADGLPHLHHLPLLTAPSLPEAADAAAAGFNTHVHTLTDAHARARSRCAGTPRGTEAQRAVADADTAESNVAHDKARDDAGRVDGGGDTDGDDAMMSEQDISHGELLRRGYESLPPPRTRPPSGRLFSVPKWLQLGPLLRSFSTGAGGSATPSTAPAGTPAGLSRNASAATMACSPTVAATGAAPRGPSVPARASAAGVATASPARATRPSGAGVVDQQDVDAGQRHQQQRDHSAAQHPQPSWSPQAPMPRSATPSAEQLPQQLEPVAVAPTPRGSRLTPRGSRLLVGAWSRARAPAPAPPTAADVADAMAQSEPFRRSLRGSTDGGIRVSPRGVLSTHLAAVTVPCTGTEAAYVPLRNALTEAAVSDGPGQLTASGPPRARPAAWASAPRASSFLSGRAAPARTSAHGTVAAAAAMVAAGEPQPRRRVQARASFSVSAAEAWNTSVWQVVFDASAVPPTPAATPAAGTPVPGSVAPHHLPLHYQARQPQQPSSASLGRASGVGSVRFALEGEVAEAVAEEAGADQFSCLVAAGALDQLMLCSTGSDTRHSQQGQRARSTGRSGGTAATRALDPRATKSSMSGLPPPSPAPGVHAGMGAHRDAGAIAAAAPAAIARPQPQPQQPYSHPELQPQEGRPSAPITVPASGRSISLDVRRACNTLRPPPLRLHHMNRSRSTCMDALDDADAASCSASSYGLASYDDRRHRAFGGGMLDATLTVPRVGPSRARRAASTASGMATHYGAISPSSYASLSPSPHCTPQLSMPSHTSRMLAFAQSLATAPKSAAATAPAAPASSSATPSAASGVSATRRRSQLVSARPSADVHNAPVSAVAASPTDRVLVATHAHATTRHATPQPATPPACPADRVAEVWAAAVEALDVSGGPQVAASGSARGGGLYSQASEPPGVEHPFAPPAPSHQAAVSVAGAVAGIQQEGPTGACHGVAVAGEEVSAAAVVEAEVESAEVWHEVVAVGCADPSDGSRLVVLMQRDVTAKVVAERHVALVSETEHRLLEQLFPRHVLQYITEETCPGPEPVCMASWRPYIRDCNRLATSHEQVTLLFADIQGFTPMCKVLPARVVMAFLNDLFSRFDAMLDEHGVYKVETIGDCYMVAGGLIRQDQDGMAAVAAEGDGPGHAAAVVAFARAMLSAARSVRLPTSGEPVRMRVGVHSGPLVSGVVGTRMPRFCLFGDTVNTASRMESTGVPGAIHVSAATRRLLRDDGHWTATNGVQVRGKGLAPSYVWRPEGGDGSAGWCRDMDSCASSGGWPDALTTIASHHLILARPAAATESLPSIAHDPAGLARAQLPHSGALPRIGSVGAGVGAGAYGEAVVAQVVDCRVEAITTAAAAGAVAAQASFPGFPGSAWVRGR